MANLHLRPYSCSGIIGSDLKRNAQPSPRPRPKYVPQSNLTDDTGPPPPAEDYDRTHDARCIARSRDFRLRDTEAKLRRINSDQPAPPGGSGQALPLRAGAPVRNSPTQPANPIARARRPTVRNTIRQHGPRSSLPADYRRGSSDPAPFPTGGFSAPTSDLSTESPPAYYESTLYELSHKMMGGDQVGR